MGYELDFGALLQYLSLFAEGTAVTLGLTAVAAALGLALSIAGAAAATAVRPSVTAAPSRNKLTYWRSAAKSSS